MAKDNLDEYDEDLFEDFGEGFEDEFDAISEKVYEEAFNKQLEEAKEASEETEEVQTEMLKDEEIDEAEYEFDEVVGGRDKKPIMSTLNKGKLSKYEMDDLLNGL
ncbi:MAG: hypothetical protein AB7V77_00250 [Candidatus Woesearchaeota archaeon]